MKNIIIVLILASIGSFGCSRNIVKHESTLNYTSNDGNTELRSKDAKLYLDNNSVYAKKGNKVYIFNSLNNESGRKIKGN